ncbi:DUF1501 domain-containing protein [Sphingomonas xinjiangensis]|uniref:Uncharacterized protein (DUF1501 family) n=1 Tax=Sphingomonas xinjiangensis TaxID=643568 RepID=A0A840YGQ2_9SPHN|nr:DUF1501 domain-containing protein [Sphingomonas xinjiangensis]MBB5711485.1 uncharacterized protein (DUF1501 family) [Sphingomonas xinjiangensis]
MTISRREFMRLTAGAGALAAFGQLGRTTAMAAPSGSYRAMVGIFLFGGNDGWNMVIPTDARHATYLSSRGSVGIKAAALTPLTNASYALHPAMDALRPVWDEGGLGLVLNAGTLFAPLTKDTYKSRADLRPSNLMSHADEQAHWQGLRAREFNVDGFMGRLSDRAGASATPSMISLGGSNLATIGKTSSALVLPSTGTLGRNGFSGATGAANLAKNAAVDAFANGASYGVVTEATARDMTGAYGQATTANSILTATGAVDGYFVNPNTGAALTSDVARQLMRVARVIEARGTLGHNRQTFFVSQGGFDNHSGQVGGGNNDTGTHANLLRDLAMALAGFYKAMKAIGLGENVTAFTMSDFGRTFKGNAQNGTDHAWGSNHLVVGGNVTPGGIFGAYPDPVLGGANDIANDGRFVPAVSQEEYIGAIARWHGVSDADMPYVFPNWSTWSGGGRGPLGLFRG